MEKVDRAIELQFRVNHQIEIYGEANHYDVDELMEIVDSLNNEESDLFTRLYFDRMNII
jgi:hypothetical protein